MSVRKNLRPIPGSERDIPKGARAIGSPDPNERIEVTIRIRPRAASTRLASIESMSPSLPSQRQYLSRDQLENELGADPDDIEKIREFAKENGLEVVEVKPGGRNIRIAGTTEAISNAFGVQLMNYESPQGKYRGRTGPVNVPSDLSYIVEGVFGLDTRLQAKPHFVPLGRIQKVRPKAIGISYVPTQIAQLYDFPAGMDGSGQCIGIIELGGGYRPEEMKKYFTDHGIAIPNIVDIPVNGGKNDPNNPETKDANGEVALDIEVAAAVAPKAKIAVYFASNTDDGFIDAINAAIHDKTNKPSVISISWGNAEGLWTDQAMQAMDEEFQAASAIGVTVCCASGDDGSRDDPGNELHDNLAHVDFPASSPYALACGGTRLQSSSNTITKETAWNNGPGSAGGGGISDHFPMPDWQKNAGIPPSVNPGGRIGRGVPDVAGDADPETGYIVFFDGEEGVIGGTSAVAPLWSGLIALLNQGLGKPVGYMNPIFYTQFANAGIFNDITEGSNGAYQASQGWDACTGWGSPIGSKLLQALGGQVVPVHEGQVTQGMARASPSSRIKKENVKLQDISPLFKAAVSTKPRDLSGTGFTYRHDWGDLHGQWILILNWDAINCNSRVFVSAAEFGGGDNCDFIGAARYTVHNVSPFNGGVSVWLEIEWDSDIRVHLDYLVINP